MGKIWVTDIKRYSKEWWDKLEIGKLEPASLFNRTALVISPTNARAMVIEALEGAKKKRNKK